jgi:hypothetical protein
MGAAGLVLWFPVAASRILPGWMFNVALFVHGAEAALAIGFIFAVHFFNGHLRPGKFPMDMVIFTGRCRRTNCAKSGKVSIIAFAPRTSLAPAPRTLRLRPLCSTGTSSGQSAWPSAWRCLP